VTQLLLYERNNGHAYFTELLCGWNKTVHVEP
jgi:hypothetical protein